MGLDVKVKAMCHIHIEALVVTNWIPDFLRPSLFFG